MIILLHVDILNSVNEDEMDTAAERSNVEMDSTAPLFRSDASGSFLLPDSGQFDLQVSHLNIPPDQTRTIHNITTLISEVGSVSSCDIIQFQLFLLDSIFPFFLLVRSWLSMTHI